MTKEERAKKMREYQKLGVSYLMIASILGTNKDAVMKELVPGYLEKSRASSLRWKHKNRKKCLDCGKPIWHDAIRCHQHNAAARTKWTEETVISAIQRFHAENGRPPYSREWDTADPEKGYPPKSQVYGKSNPFPSWNAAIAAAGFTPTLPGHRRR